MRANANFSAVKAPSPWGRNFRDMVGYRLRLGFGVEDIAVQLDCRPVRVRECVSQLREDGTLARWWPKRGETQ